MNKITKFIFKNKKLFYIASIEKYNFLRRPLVIGLIVNLILGLDLYNFDSYENEKFIDSSLRRKIIHQVTKK